MSIRWKIALALALVALVATTVVGVIGYRSTSNRLLDEVDQSMRQAAVVVSQQRLGQRLPERGPLALYKLQFVDPQGEVLASTLDETATLTEASKRAVGISDLTVRETVTIDGDPVRVHTIGLQSGAFQIFRPLDETERVLDDVRSRTVLLVVLVSFGAAVAGWLIAAGVARPLQRLTRAAEEVGASGVVDASVDIPAGGHDEVGTLGSAFQRMLVALANSRDAQQRLVQDAGHELRTPLTSLQTNLSVLRRHRNLPEETRDDILSDLDSEVGELTMLVDELVAAASGQMSTEPMSLVDLAAAAGEAAERVARRHGREVAVDARAGAMVEVPSQALDRAVANLVENACKFDDSSSPVELLVEGGSLRVMDRGPGLPADETDLVFERFHRAESARAMPGSGLGLAIVREVVERCGGTVHASNRPGGGASIGFDLPVASGDDGGDRGRA